VAAYLSVDAAAGASATREKIVTSPRPAAAQLSALLEVEDVLEGGTREATNGGRLDPSALKQKTQASAQA
jgi:hypothetical protein